MACETCGAPTGWVDGTSLVRANEAKRAAMGDAKKLRTENQELREALAELEAANDALCQKRTQEQHLKMLSLGQQNELLRLDEARRVARALVTPNV